MLNRAKSNRRARFFTMIELLLVLEILATLAAIVLPKFTGRSEQARVTAAQTEISGIELALDAYEIDNGFYPSTEQGLQALVQKPAVGKTPRNYPQDGYMDKIPKDPWGNDYVYISPVEHGDFDLISYGPDGEEGGKGNNKDIKNWKLE